MTRPTAIQLALNLVSMALILPSGLMACAVLGITVLTTVPWDVIFWRAIQGLVWLPVILATIAVAALAGLALLIRFPALRPALLFAAGFSSFAILVAAADQWLQEGDASSWTALSLGLLGTALAGWQLWHSAFKGHRPARRVPARHP